MRRGFAALFAGFIVALATLSSGCTSTMTKARDTGAFKLNCDPERTSVNELSDSTFGVWGCGRRVVCKDIFFVGIHCETVMRDVDR